MAQLPPTPPTDDVQTRARRTAFVLIGIALGLSLFWGSHFQRKFGPGGTAVPPAATAPAQPPASVFVDTPTGRVEIRRTYSPEGQLLREEAYQDGKPVPMPPQP